MPAGSYTLRLKILGAGEFNLNWFEFAEVITGFSLNSELDFYPNPAKEFIKFYPSKYDYYSIVSMDGSRLLYGEIPKNNHLSLKSLNARLVCGKDDESNYREECEPKICNCRIASSNTD